MFIRLVDVVLIKPSGESLVIVDSKEYPNTFMCSGNFNRYSGTESDKLTISIYNLPANIRGDISLGYYSTIYVKYGYKDEQEMPSELFVGNIVRRFNKRVDEVTTETRIVALDTGAFAATSFFSASYADDANLYAIAEDILRQAKEEGTIDSYDVSSKLKEYNTYATKCYYGASQDALIDVSTEGNLVYKRTNNSISILTPDEIINQDTAVVFSVYDETTGRVESRSGLIGIPELTDSGVQIECLVNPSISVYSLIKINNSILTVNKSENTYSDSDFGATFDPDGLYVVTSISGNFSNDSQNNSMSLTCLSRNVFYSQYQEEK